MTRPWLHHADTRTHFVSDDPSADLTDTLIAALDADTSVVAVGQVQYATGTTVEGQATAHYLSQLARTRGVRVTRLAHGIPLGGDLEFVDSGTLAHAFQGRMALD